MLLLMLRAPQQRLQAAAVGESGFPLGPLILLPSSSSPSPLLLSPLSPSLSPTFPFTHLCTVTLAACKQQQVRSRYLSHSPTHALSLGLSFGANPTSDLNPPAGAAAAHARAVQAVVSCSSFLPGRRGRSTALAGKRTAEDDEQGRQPSRPPEDCI